MKKLIFLSLKAANLFVITIYSFALIYILIRVVPLGFYQYIVLVSSIGNYVLATDLGYSGFIYAALRRGFLGGFVADQVKLVSEALNVYVLIALLAAALMAVVVISTLPGAMSIRTALAVYFLSIVMSLPWALVRKVAAGVDLFILFEVLELARRITFLGLASLMLIGLPFLYFSLLCLGVWAASFLGALLLLARKNMLFRPASMTALATHVSENKQHILRSGRFTILEFIIYNYPYIVLPFIFHAPRTIIAFDVFYKVVRFGTVAFAVPAETFLPYQTRAFYEGRPEAVVGYAKRVMALGLLPLIAASAILIVFGGEMFHHLLKHAAVITIGLRLAMVGMLAAMLFQTASGTFLVGVGEYVGLGRVATITAGLMVALVALCRAMGSSFEVFMAGYVAVYAIHAVMFQVYFRRFRGSGVVVPSTALASGLS